jgi:hypothetical protein
MRKDAFIKTAKGSLLVPIHAVPDQPSRVSSHVLPLPHGAHATIHLGQGFEGLKEQERGEHLLVPFSEESVSSLNNIRSAGRYAKKVA